MLKTLKAVALGTSVLTSIPVGLGASAGEIRLGHDIGGLIGSGLGSGFRSGGLGGSGMGPTFPPMDLLPNRPDLPTDLVQIPLPPPRINPVPLCARPMKHQNGRVSSVCDLSDN